MRNWKRLIPYLAGITLAVAAFAILKTPKVSAAIRATLVELVIPSNTFYDTMSLTNTARSIGPDTGTLGVTNITITNFDSGRQQLFIFAPIFANGGCGGSGANIIGGGSPQMQLYLQPFETLTLPYPSPLTFHGVSGHTCIAAEVTTILNGGSVQVAVNGFVN